MSELLDLIQNTLEEKLGENIATISLEGVNPYTDYFVLVTARNVRHADSLATEVIHAAAKESYPLRTREGAEGSTWILVDFNDVIVHIFTEEARMQYRLENLYGDCPIQYLKDQA